MMTTSHCKVPFLNSTLSHQPSLAGACCPLPQCHRHLQPPATATCSLSMTAHSRVAAYCSSLALLLWGLEKLFSCNAVLCPAEGHGKTSHIKSIIKHSCSGKSQPLTCAVIIVRCTSSPSLGFNKYPCESSLQCPVLRSHSPARHCLGSFDVHFSEIIPEWICPLITRNNPKYTISFFWICMLTSKGEWGNSWIFWSWCQMPVSFALSYHASLQWSICVPTFSGSISASTVMPSKLSTQF